jgi:hypothetical protein
MPAPRFRMPTKDEIESWLEIKNNGNKKEQTALN